MGNEANATETPAWIIAPGEVVEVPFTLSPVLVRREAAWVLYGPAPPGMRVLRTRTLLNTGEASYVFRVKSTGERQGELERLVFVCRDPERGVLVKTIVPVILLSGPQVDQPAADRGLAR